MKRASLLALSLLAALPLAATAQNASGLNYNYVEGGYVATNLDNDNGDVDADGFGGNASFALSDNFHVFGGYNTQEIDGFNVDVDQWQLGAGYNYEIAPKADLVTRIAYEKLSADGGADVDGYSAEVGVRGALASKVEAYAMAGYQDFEQVDGDFYGRVGAQVKFNENWGVSGDVKFADGDTQWFVGPRFTW